MAGNGTQGRRPAGADDSGYPVTEHLAERLALVMRLARLCARPTEIANLSNARYEFLHSLFHHGPQRMGLIAQRLGVAARTVTPMADALETEDLITRTTDPIDRRAQLVELTTKGFEVLRTARRVRLAAVGTLFESLTPHERSVFDELLHKIINSAVSGTSREERS